MFRVATDTIRGMILNDDDIRFIVRSRQGQLEEIPFAVLLFALARAERSVTLEISRGPLTKSILIEEGCPVQCASNLAHETLSRYMESTGRLDHDTANECFAESCATGARFGDVLIRKNLISAEELVKILQKNLARKLLDGFAWHQGTYRILDIPPDVDSTLRTNVPQLIVFGVSRFASQEQVDATIGPYRETKLAVHPSPAFPLEEIRLNPLQSSVIQAVRARVRKIDELATTTGVPEDEIARMLCPLILIGAVVPADQLPTEELAAEVRPEHHPSPVSRERETPPEANDSDERREELMQLMLNFRRKDAFELLGVDPDHFDRRYHDRYLEFAEKFAPWTYPKDLSANARRVFIAGARAYGDLADPTRRQALLDRRRTPPEEPAAPSAPPGADTTFEIKTDLLDPEVQHRKGLELMAERNYRDAITQLAYASDLDPQNGDYRAELAYCRFLSNPLAAGPQALEDLTVAIRIDPRSGLAYFLKGEVLAGLDRFDEAEESYRRAIKPMAPDRRPIEALRKLQRRKKTRKRNM
jgi:hypothetical protein